MAAYIMIDIEVTDPVVYEEYRVLAGPTVLAAGGKYVVRGGAAEVLEGDHVPHRVVVLEFPTVAAAKAWHASAGYAPLKAMRQRASHTDMIVVEGV